jgi:hypothetical protein
MQEFEPSFFHLIFVSSLYPHKILLVLYPLRKTAEHVSTKHCILGFSRDKKDESHSFFATFQVLLGKVHSIAGKNALGAKRSIGVFCDSHCIEVFQPFVGINGCI